MADRIIVPGSRPGRVVAELPVPLPRPRRRTGVDFQRIVEQSLATIRPSLPAAA